MFKFIIEKILSLNESISGLRKWIAKLQVILIVKFLDSDLDRLKITELVLEKEVDPKELSKILNWMEKQLIPDEDYVKQLLGIS